MKKKKSNAAGEKPSRPHIMLHAQSTKNTMAIPLNVTAMVRRSHIGQCQPGRTVVAEQTSLTCFDDVRPVTMEEPWLHLKPHRRLQLALMILGLPPWNTSLTCFDYVRPVAMEEPRGCRTHVFLTCFDDVRSVTMEELWLPFARSVIPLVEQCRDKEMCITQRAWIYTDRTTKAPVVSPAQWLAYFASVLHYHSPFRHLTYGFECLPSTLIQWSFSSQLSSEGGIASLSLQESKKIKLQSLEEYIDAYGIVIY